MPTQLAYSTIQGSTAHPSAATIAAPLPVNFSGQYTDGSMSEFALGGWFRVTSFPNFGSGPTLFLATNQFRLSINDHGVLVAGFESSGMAGAVMSATAIPDSEWHYASVTYQQTNQATAGGTLQLFLDGIEVASNQVNTSASLTQGVCVIGEPSANGNEALLQFASWSIWETALSTALVSVPELGPPLPNSDAAATLAAAFDFTGWPNGDVSGKKVPIQMTAGPIFVPRLALQNNSQVLLDSNGTTHIAVGGPAPFTVMSWAYVSPADNYNVLQMLKSKSSDSALTDFFAVAIVGLGQLVVGRRPGLLQSVKIEPDRYSHFAITYDGTTFFVYVNGAVVYQQAAPAATLQPIVTPITRAGLAFGKSDFPGEMQGLSIWNVALTQGQIQDYWRGTDPWGAPGLVTLCDFEYDISDAVSGRALAATNAFIADSAISQPMISALGTGHKQAVSHDDAAFPLGMDPEMQALIQAMPASDTAQPAMSAKSIVGTQVLAPGRDLNGGAPSNLPQFGNSARLKALSARSGVDTKTPVDLNALSDVQKETLMAFEPYLNGLPQRQANLLREEFLRNIRIGEDHAATGYTAARFEIRDEGGKTAFHFYDDQGGHEVHRLEVLLTPQQEYWMRIALDVCFLVMAMFGIVTSAAQAAGMVGPLQALADEFAAYLAKFTGNGIGGPTANALACMKAWVKLAWDRKALVSLAWAMLKTAYQATQESWWNLGFAVLSIVAQLLALLTSGGLLIAVRIAQMGLSLHTLIVDLKKGPPPMQASGETAYRASSAATN